MPKLHLHCFGTLRVTLDGEPLTDFGTDKARALLAYLAVEADRPHHRERLAGLLWSDQPEKRALHSLRQTLSYLRKAVGDDEAATPFLLVERDTLQMNPASAYWLDARAFRETLALAQRHYRRRNGRGRLDIRRLQQAVALCQGPFLDQFFLSGSPLFDEWLTLQREDYSQRVVEALAWLAEYYERRGEFALARQAAAQLADLTPWDEAAHFRLMRLLASDGQWSAAQNQYATLRRRLNEQLAAEPSRETTALFNHIRSAAINQSPLALPFPPARHNLPESPTSLVGREAELDTLSERVADPECRLLTLLGPGGVGKTRLALEAARAQVGLFPDGVFFVPLVSLRASDHLPSAIADGLGVPFSERSEPHAQLLDYLRRKHLLLVLDNYEHLLSEAGSTQWLAEILQQAPEVMLLVTSRERLNLHEEVVYPLTGLAYPEGTSRLPEAPETYAALALFARRANQLGKPLTWDAARLSAAIRICQMLDGLPLGLELAAAAIWSHTCDEIADRMARDLDALTGPISNLPARHRSLRAAFEVSWERLSPAEQAAFCRLAVFRGGFDAPAALAVAEASPETLAGLRDKSLLRGNAAGRYDLHEVLRQFATDHLSERPDLASATLARHAQHYANQLTSQAQDLKGPGQAEALAAVHQDIDNARAAWNWLAENRCRQLLCQCADSLYQYFNIRSRFAEGIALFGSAAQVLGAADEPELTSGILASRLGALAYRARDHALAETALERSQEILTSLGHQAELAFCQIMLGGLRLRQKAYEAALTCAQASLASYRQIGDPWGEAHALYLLGLIKNRQGDFAAAKTWLAGALAIGRQSGNAHRLISPLNLLGDIACTEGDYASAERFFVESLELCRRLHDRYNEAILLNNLATVYQARQLFADERRAFEASAVICREIGDRDGEAIALNGLGEMAVFLGQYQEAVTFSQRALEIACQVGEAWTLIICHNSLGEAYRALGETALAEEHLRQALQSASEIEAVDLLTRVAVSLARLYQQRHEPRPATTLLQAALAHSAIDDEARTKAQRWLAEMGARPDPELDDEALGRALRQVMAPCP